MEPAGRDHDDTEYTLVLDEGEVATFFRSLADPALRLTATGLSWSRHDEPRQRCYDEIVSVRLQTRWLGSASGGVCTIGFRDGSALNANGMTVHDTFDEELSATYRAFVIDLHGRLTSRACPEVAFHSGPTPAKRKLATVGLVGMIMGAIICFIVLIVDFSFGMFLSAGTAIAIVVGSMQNREESPEGTYRPDAIPPTLLP